MPLKAIADGVTITGPDLSGEEWRDLWVRHKKGLPVMMACCGAPGHLRVSKRGTQHFYHAVDTGCRYAEESREHLEIKYLVYRTCRAEGWETYVEYPAPDRAWVSDVCAIRDGRKVVFEIQISTITTAVLEERDTKYRDGGIEPYWLLDNFLGLSRDFASGYRAYLFRESGCRGREVPYLDDSLFRTGPENHIFIAKGIRSIGLHAKKQALYTTNNPEISIAAWVKEVLKGNYKRYLDETAAAIEHRRRLSDRAAPVLLRVRDYYHAIVRDKTYRKRTDSLYRVLKAGGWLQEEPALQGRFDAIHAEIDWLEQEYRTMIGETYGLFSWKKSRVGGPPRPVFLPDQETKIRQLEARVNVFDRWEASFERAVEKLEEETSSRKIPDGK